MTEFSRWLEKMRIILDIPEDKWKETERTAKGWVGVNNDATWTSMAAKIRSEKPVLTKVRGCEAHGVEGCAAKGCKPDIKPKEKTEDAPMLITTRGPLFMDQQIIIVDSPLDATSGKASWLTIRRATIRGYFISDDGQLRISVLVPGKNTHFMTDAAVGEVYADRSDFMNDFNGMMNDLTT